MPMRLCDVCGQRRIPVVFDNCLDAGFARHSNSGVWTLLGVLGCDVALLAVAVDGLGWLVGGAAVWLGAHVVVSVLVFGIITWDRRDEERMRARRIARGTEPGSPS